MDSNTDVLAARVRETREAVDRDFEELRLRTRALEPRRVASRWGATAAPVAAGVVAVWLWQRRRRSMRSLQDLLVKSLRELYRGEALLIPALGRMSEAAANPDLAALFRRHADESRQHRDRLTRVLRNVDATPPSGGTSAAMQAIDADGRRLLKRKANAEVRDAWLIATAQRAEHLEIANYGTARTFAATLGYTDAAQLLQQTLEEERAMDAQLSRLAERFINPQSLR